MGHYHALALGIVALAFHAVAARAQTGVSDDRVSLPDGPGSVQGIGDNATVNPNMGMFSTSVDVEVPEGFAGITPQLSFTYSSGGGGNSVVGIGWSFATPSIERMTSRQIPDYDDADVFVGAAGEQLTRTSSGEPAEYRARFEGGFVRYRWFQRGSGAEGYWTAETPDGVVSYFGADHTGTLVETARTRAPDGVFRYQLVESINPFGHTTSYAYRFYGSRPLLDLISYAYDAQGNATQSVTFTYEPRPDVVSNASGGFNDELANRLTQVQVWTNTSLVRSYELVYEPASETRGQTRLARIETRGAQGGLQEVVHRFTYSQSLSGVCAAADCAAPFLVDMGSLGAGFGNGQATLLDLNGDGLPDVVRTPTGQPHEVYLSQLAPDGTHTFLPPFQSQVAASVGMDLSSPYVQELDYDGDGFVDLVNATTGQVLVNDGSGDWAGSVDLGASKVQSLPDFGQDFTPGVDNLSHVRFFDYDGDHIIDVLRSDQTTTSVYRGLGAGGYEVDPNVEAIGAGFQEDNLELADMNGDGLLDPVIIQPGLVRYRLNLGRGHWSDWVDMENAPVDANELDFTSLEDVDNDGRDDLIVVIDGTVKVALNRNGETFEQVSELSTAGGRPLPIRDAGTTVLFADMNANGSNDVVWIDSQGNTIYLELFPERPNLMTRVENSVGGVTEIAYETAAEARATSPTPWQFPLVAPMIVVRSLDSFSETIDPSLTVHSTQEFQYTDGFFSSAERQFQGFGSVRVDMPGDVNQAPAESVITYDVGAGTDAFLAGQTLARATTSNGAPLREESFTWGSCALSGIAEVDPVFPVVWGCLQRDEMVHQEGHPESDWATVATDYDYDGYGNVTEKAEEGVVDVGGGGCGPCTNPAGTFGAPCGAQCLGDESIVDTTYASPDDNAEGRWLLHKVVEERTRASDGGREQVVRTHYDGPDFVGLALGATTKGAVTRIERVVEDGATVDVTKNRVDANGNLVESITAGGTVDGAGYRRAWVYDALGLSIIQDRITIAHNDVDDTEGTRTLVRDFTFEPVFGEVDSATDWYLDGDAPGGVTRWGYDEFGRRVFEAKPGDDVTTPTTEYEWQSAHHTRASSRGSAR